MLDTGGLCRSALHGAWQHSATSPPLLGAVPPSASHCMQAGLLAALQNVYLPISIHTSRTDACLQGLPLHLEAFRVHADRRQSGVGFRTQAFLAPILLLATDNCLKHCN